MTNPFDRDIYRKDEGFEVWKDQIDEDYIANHLEENFDNIFRSKEDENARTNTTQ